MDSEWIEKLNGLKWIITTGSFSEMKKWMIHSINGTFLVLITGISSHKCGCNGSEKIIIGECLKGMLFLDVDSFNFFGSIFPLFCWNVSLTGI